MVRLTNKRSSAGEDEISYKSLSKGGAKLAAMLTVLFNAILISGYFPIAWKSVKVKMIPKSGKDLSKAAGYRPISLSSCLSKLFEMSLKSRIENAIKRVRAENLSQSAYKKKRGCQENALRLTEHVYKAFNERKCVLGVFLDVKGAFDRLWPMGLLIKLHRWKLPLALLRVISAFMSQRKLKVCEGEATSRTIHMSAGVPQGSVISPILFNLYMDDLSSNLPEGVFISQYADDSAIWTTEICPRLAEFKIQQALKVIEDWTSTWRVQLEPSKSAAILFTRCPSHRKLKINLKLHGEPVPQEDTTRFLGILFDSKLDWTPQITSIINGTAGKINNLRNLSAKSRWSHPGKVIKFFESLVESVATYSAPCFLAMKNSLWKRLEQVHARSMKSFAGVPNYIGYDLVCDQLLIDNWPEKIKKAAIKRIKGILLTSPFGREMIHMASKNNSTYDSPVGIQQRNLA